jgi:acetyl-CoA carboxylase carboxyl transferase subunit beta
MRLFSREKPKIKVTTTKKDGFSGWLKCTHCTELIHVHELERNDNCCPKCDYHYRLTVDQRLQSLADNGTFVEMFDLFTPVDALGFVDAESYPNRLCAAQEKSGRNEAILVGTAELAGKRAALAILDFNFMAGSMGSVVGEKLTLLIEHAVAERLPLIIVSTSGGARMQESTLSLMQMAKTSAALGRLNLARLPYISVLTNPTLGGVTASFASLGDLIIAEPNALIGFAGPRVIEQNIRQKLPPEAQKSEFLLEHGMIDCIVRRQELKEKIAECLELLSDNDLES